MAASQQAVTFGRVDARHDRILVVASGPSANALPIDSIRDAAIGGAHIIAVNRAILWMPLAHSWFTLDPDRRVLPILRGAMDDVNRYAAVPDDYGTSMARVIYHRCDVPNGITYLRRIAGDGPLGSRDTLSEDPGSIHTGNSAYGAFGLAYLMKPQKIAMVGVDGTRRRYAYSRDRPLRSMDHLPALFRSSVSQVLGSGIEVRNGSKESRVGCYERCNPEEAVRWVMR